MFDDKVIKVKILIFILLFLIFLLSKEKVLDLYSKFNLKLPTIEKEIEHYLPPYLKLLEPEIEKEVFLPPPIKGEEYSHFQSFLTKEGIIKWTNVERGKYGLEPLKENNFLNASAAIKVEDMLENQYFGHYSPTGKGVEDLAKMVNYKFILIGENLALGNFPDDLSLVLSWMESPGHRENILNKRYQEIGVAVKKGIFEGKEVWFAVQHFGLPLSFCPEPEETLRKEIEEKEKEIKKISERLVFLEREIKQAKGKRKGEYEEKVEEYNLLVEKYNSWVKEIQTLVNDYNLKVQLFNQCLHKLIE